MTVTDIYEAMNSKAEAFFEWLQAHPKYGLLFGVGLLALWLAGLLFRWKWACHWQFNSKLWLFDDCKPETRRRVQIVLVSVLIILIYGQTNEKYKEDSRKSNTADRKPITYSRASNFGSKNEM